MRNVNTNATFSYTNFNREAHNGHFKVRVNESCVYERAQDYECGKSITYSSRSTVSNLRHHIITINISCMQSLRFYCFTVL